VPELCRWGSVVIRIRLDDHAWPHVHVKYAENEASLRLRDLRFVDGWLPNRQRRQVLHWAQEHHAELHKAWELMEEGRQPMKIAPPERW
jgi:hypothetical protein